MWVNFAMTGIDHQPFKVRLINQNFKQSLPHTIIAPTDEASMGIAPTAKVGGQISPWSACTHNPEDRIDKAPVVVGLASPASFTSGQMGFKLLPNGIRNVVPSVGCCGHIFLAYG